MEYTVQKLAKLAGVSTRTLRYYDEIGLLKPARINSSGYRVYGEKEVGMLQQIMFYRELGVDLGRIRDIVTSPSFDGSRALREHLERLLEQRERINLLIKNVEKTIAMTEGRITMSDKEKFEGFKRRMIEENEAKYGKEIRGNYGEETVDKSNAKLMGMSREEFEASNRLAEDILRKLEEAVETGADPAGELGREIADMHRRWVSGYWPEYSKEAHAGLAQMYVEDERFTAYYDRRKTGCAMFLRDAILAYTGVKKE